VTGEASKTAPIRIDSRVAAMPGIGPKRAAALEARGIVTAADVLFHLPARYQDWRSRSSDKDLCPGNFVVVEGGLSKISERPMRGSRWRRLASGFLQIGDRRIRVVWFNLPAYMRGYLPAGERVLLRGRVAAGADGTIEIVQPELHRLTDGEPKTIRPVYRLPSIIGQRLFSTIVTRVISDNADSIRGALPEGICADVPTIGEALRYLHDPPPDADFDALANGDSPGHRALAFDELFAFELALSMERLRSARRAGIALDGAQSLSAKMLETLSFTLTGSQARAIEEIGVDLARPNQMNRMLLGDVGSGKTLVAFWAMIRAVESGHQTAMMAPTELLAEQHYRGFQRMCGRLGVASALLTGSVTGAARNKILRGLATGEIKAVFGTHALIQQRVRIRELALGVIDEQHRFGVFDRAKLKSLGPKANLLMMTATPIPRSLAMSLFANLDVSFLDELPAGRTPISTETYAENDLERLHTAIRAEIGAGGRAYYVVPFVEGDEDEPRSVAATAERLKKGVLRSARIGTMHGRMSAAEKDRAMRSFRDGAIDLLVCTTVVEVGIDVPEATVIVVLAAERYGLAQLHQLRGRVGRGERASRCCLVASADADDAVLERLRIMRECTTGALVADADLRLRGPGDLLGARQTGALPLRFVHLIRDHRTIERARTLADEWLARDPSLANPASNGARVAVRKMLSLGFSLGDVG
jgi:ATP-dependent DNA helicase RecG